MEYRIANIEIDNRQKLKFYQKEKNYFVDKQSAILYFGYTGKADNWLHDIVVQLSKYIKIYEKLIYDFEHSQSIKVSDVTSEVILASSFLAVCNLLTFAKEDGYLYISEYKYTDQAISFLNFLQNEPIELLVDNYSGLQLHNHNLKVLLRKEATANKFPLAFWLVTFDDVFIQNMLKLAGITANQLYQNTEIVLTLIDELIFSRLEDDTSNYLATTTPKRKYGKFKGPVTFVADPELKRHVDIVNALLVVAQYQQTILKQLIDKIHPRKREPITIEYPNRSIPKQIAILDELQKILGNR